MLISQPHDISIAVGFVHIFTTSSSVYYFRTWHSQELYVAKDPTLCQAFFPGVFLPQKKICEFDRLLTLNR